MGGSTRIPYVRKLLKGFFGKKKARSNLIGREDVGQALRALIGPGVVGQALRALIGRGDVGQALRALIG